MLIVPPPMHRRGTSLMNAMRNLGLTTNLKLCLDAGDKNSYDGSSQSWLDLSGNGSNFYRGTGSGSDAADPTFNGTAGGESSAEYFSSDGGDYFTMASANPSWLDSFHKDGAAFTVLCWTNKAFGGGDCGLTGTGMGFGADIATATHPGFTCFNGASTVLSVDSTLVFPTLGAWSFQAFSFDETAGNVVFCIDGSFDAQSGKTYSGPSAGAATYPFQLGSPGDGSQAMPSGRKYAAIAMCNAAFSQTQIGQVYNATKGKFGY